MLLKEKGNFPGFFRRLKFYVFGFLLGLVLVTFLFKGRSGCKMPGTLKLEELSNQEIVYGPQAECRMKCSGISAQNIKDVLSVGKINYSKSNVQGALCPSYTVEGVLKDGKNLAIIINDCDTISKVTSAIDLSIKNDTCNCK